MRDTPKFTRGAKSIRGEGDDPADRSPAQRSPAQRWVVERSRQGDRRAFSELVELYDGVLSAYAHRLARDAVEADELVQGTFVEAFRSLDRLRDADRFEPWLKGICRNLHLRRQRERAREADILDLERLPEEPIVSVTTVGWAGGLSASELFEAISSEIDALPSAYRMVLMLRHFSGLSCRVIAERLDLPIGTVTMRLSRGHRQLREALTRQLRLSEGDAP